MSKGQVATFSEQLQQLEDDYKQTRWIVDVIATARDKSLCSGPDVSKLYSSVSTFGAPNAICNSEDYITDNASHFIEGNSHDSETLSPPIEFGGDAGEASSSRVVYGYTGDASCPSIGCGDFCEASRAPIDCGDSGYSGSVGSGRRFLETYV